MNTLKQNWRHSLATKLFLFIGMTVFVTVSVIAGRDAYQFRSILEAQLSDKNINSAQNALTSISSKLHMWVGQINQSMRFIAVFPQDKVDPFLADLVNFNKEFVSFQLIKNTDEKFQTSSFAFTEKTTNVNFIDKKPEDIKKILFEKGLELAKKLAQDKNKRAVYLANLTTDLKIPMLSIIIPAKTGDNSYNWGILTVWQEPMYQTLTSDNETKSFLINDSGEVLVSSSLEDNKNPKTYQSLALVSIALKGTSEAGKKSFVNESKTEILGAYAYASDFKMAVVYLHDPTEAYKQITKETVKTILISIIFFFLVILIAFHAIGKLTSNLRKLVSATLEISKGNFSTKVNLQSKDEIEELGSSINLMSGKIEQLLETQVEQARQEKELETAKAVQQTLFPKEDVNEAQIQVTGSYVPASECGGDWWGHFSTNKEIEFLCIADATGHGAPAALVTAMAYSSCMMVAEIYNHAEFLHENPKALLERLNHVMWNAGLGVTTMTFFASFINMKTGIVTFANAGHNIPIIIPSNPDDTRLIKGKVKKRHIIMQSKGTPLGMTPDSTYENYQMQLMPGDKLFLYTDGLIECKNPNGEMFGKRKMTQLLEEMSKEKYSKIKSTMFEKAFEYYDKRPLDDDITIVVAELSQSWTPQIQLQE